MSLKEIQDQVAKERAHISWEDLTAIGRSRCWPEVNQRYARECVKASLEEASENAVIFMPSHRHLHGTKNVDKSSITNESNIVLL